MKLKKIIAAVAAAAVAVSMMAIGASAATVEIDAESPGAWSSSGKGITKAELEAVGGDVRIVLSIETLNPYGLADQFLVNPIDYDGGWVSQTDFITSDTEVAKQDGWICIREGATTCEFVFSADAISALGDSGLCFSANNVLVKSAEYELGTPQAVMTRLTDAEGKEYCFSAAEEAAPAVEETPAADTTTTSTSTGNTTAAVMVSVMAVAGIAAIAAKKRK